MAAGKSAGSLRQDSAGGKYYKNKRYKFSGEPDRRFAASGVLKCHKRKSSAGLNEDRMAKHALPGKRSCEAHKVCAARKMKCGSTHGMRLPEKQSAEVYKARAAGK